MVAKPFQASRLFGTAVAGVKHVGRKHPPSRPGNGSRIKGGVAAAMVRRDQNQGKDSAIKKVRGRGPRRFEPSAAPTASLRAARTLAPGVALQAQTIAETASPRVFAGPGAEAFNGPVRVVSAAGVRRHREPARFEGGANRGPRRRTLDDWSDAPPGPRWQHDQFDGPPSVGSSVFVRNLPKGTTPHQLTDVFGQLGPVASVVVDEGPLPTATVSFVRQDVALMAQRKFHGRPWRGELLKVSVKESTSSNKDDGDEDFWRKELAAMSSRSSRRSLAPGAPDSTPGRSATVRRGRGFQALLYDRIG